MKINSIFYSVWVLSIVTMGFFVEANADTVAARCDVYPLGEDHTSVSIPCEFSQRQGFVTIARSDGVYHDLKPVGNEPGNFSDQHGRTVYRQSGLGKYGLIFRFPDESVFVFWDPPSSAAMNSAGDPADSPTAPYTTREYDATTLFTCSIGSPSYDQDCPAGILRGDSGSASIRIMNPMGEERVLNFDQGDVTTPGDGVLGWRRQEGDWHINIDDNEFYIVIEAAVYGG